MFLIFLTDPQPTEPPKNAAKRFEEASCQMQKSVQRHLQSALVTSDDDGDSSEEELTVNVLETVFKGYSGTDGNFNSFILYSVFIKDPGDQGSIPGQIRPKTQKMVLDASLLYTQHYKVWIRGKMEQSRKRSSALLYTLV